MLEMVNKICVSYAPKEVMITCKSFSISHTQNFVTIGASLSKPYISHGKGMSV